MRVDQEPGLSSGRPSEEFGGPSGGEAPPPGSSPGSSPGSYPGSAEETLDRSLEMTFRLYGRRSSLGLAGLGVFQLCYGAEEDLDGGDPEAARTKMAQALVAVERLYGHVFTEGTGLRE